MHTPIELAEAFIQTGELGDALDALCQHLEANPDDADARRLRASVLLHLPDHAREALADLDALTVTTADDLLLKAQTFEALGEPEAAFTAIEQAWTAHHDPRSAELLLRALFRRGETNRALELLADLPKSWKWLGWSGDFYALKGDNAIASEHFCSALDQLDQAEKNALTEMQKATLLLKRAEAYRRLKRYVEAEADYRAAEAIVPSDPMISFNRGLMIFEQGNLRAALPLCRDALDHAPEGLHDHMRRVLTTDPRYKALVQALML
jgi:tetratricopeptide (TPR) repeat protein